MLGPLTVWTSDGRSVPIPEAKVRVLLAGLLVEPGRVIPADRLVENLWGERPPAKPLPSLRSKASQLRRALEEAEPGGRELVRHRTGGYLLAVDAQDVDAGRFAALVERARSEPDSEARERTLSEALSLWRGEAFTDLGAESFAEPAAIRLAELRLSALEDLYQARLELGRHSAVSGDLADLVRRHPFRERLRAVHIRALYATGRQSDALQSYLDLRSELDRELGVEPGPELAELYQSILRHDRGLGAFAAGPARDDRDDRGGPGNLTAPATALIGRQEQASEVRDLLATERLVTLTGAGGVGKTRLALDVAAGLTGEFGDGVWLVELAPLSEPSQIAEAVAAALRLRDDTGAGPEVVDAHLFRALGDREALIVLDNGEHLVEELAVFVDRLLGVCPGTRLLVTSRESLRLPAEHVRVVRPLEPPEGDTPDDLRRSSAARLFVERAAAAAPGFALLEGNAEAVAALCRRLDGVPLALELAATRVRGLGVHELAARLDDRFTTLTVRYRGIPERHRTLRAVIDWSWDLLEAVEQRVLRRLAVHADGCALAAAETVSAFDGVDRTEVLDTLTRLVDRSLVTVTFHGGRPRYRLLESVNAYCRERLREAGEEEAAYERARAHYVTLAEQAEAGLRGRRQREALARLDLEALNIRAVLGRAVQAGDAATALRLAAATTWYFFLRGRYHEAHRALAEARIAAELAPVPDHLRGTRARVAAWCEAIAMLAGTSASPCTPEATADQAFAGVDDPVGQARAAWFVLHARADLGDHSGGPKSLDPVVDRLRAEGDLWGTAAALATRARYALVLGDLEAVRRDAEEAMALFDRVGDQWGQLRAAAGMAYLAEITGDYDRATALHRDGLGMAERLSLAPEVVGRLSGLGRIALLTGDHGRADDLHGRAARLAAERFDRQGEAFAEFGLAIGARRQGRLAEAERWWNRLLPWCRSAGDLPGVAFGTTELGFAAELRGDAETALDTHLRGVEAARETGDPRALALALEGTAGACALYGQVERAARLLGAATALRASVGAPLPETESADVDRISVRCRELLGERYEAEFGRGERADPGDLVLEAARDRVSR